MPGERIKGRVRTTDRWDRLTNGRYVSDAFIQRNTRPHRPRLSRDGRPRAPAVGPIRSPERSRPQWTLPVPTTTIGGFRTVGRPEHDGVDLPHARNTPIVSVAAGTVVTVRCNTSGPTCDVDGSPSIRGCGWYVEVQHADDIVTRYCHMVRQPEVKVGDTVDDRPGARLRRHAPATRPARTCTSRCTSATRPPAPTPSTRSRSCSCRCTAVTPPRPPRKESSMNIRLVVVDEHALIRLGLTRLLAGVADIDLVGEAGSSPRRSTSSRTRRPTSSPSTPACPTATAGRWPAGCGAGARPSGWCC